MPWMYILKCSDGSYYVGSTMHLRQRVGQHADGAGSRYVAQRRPATVVYVCEFQSMREAYERENQVKKWTRAKKEALITGNYELLPDLAVRRTENAQE